jgi:hypothetical protein
MDRARAAVAKMVKEQGIGNSLRGHDPSGEPDGIVSDHRDLVSLHASTHILVTDIAELLTKRYPGFNWGVQPSEFGKVFNIFCLDFSGRWGYRIKYTDIMDDPRRREAVKAGREILHRFKYPGTIYRPDLMAKVQRNIRGEAIPDIADFRNDRFKTRVQVEQAIADGRGTVVGTKGAGQIIEIREGSRRRE